MLGDALNLEKLLKQRAAVIAALCEFSRAVQQILESVSSQQGQACEYDISK
jgi:hypothetical protein